MSKSPNRLFGLVLGVLYLIAGIGGFFLTSSTDFAATRGPKLLDLFAVNPLHNLVHLVFGAALLIASLVGVRAAKAVNSTIGTLFLLLGVIGLLSSAATTRSTSSPSTAPTPC